MRNLALPLLGAFLGVSSLLPAADPALLNLVMQDAQVVSGVNLAKAKTSPFGQFVLRQLPTDGDFAKFINASGFDPRRDLQEVLMASTGASNGIVVARGTFDASKIAALAVTDGKHKVIPYSGAQVIVSVDPAQTQALALFDTSLAAAGDLNQVKAALDRRKLATAVNPALAAKIALYASADAWAVSTVSLASLGDAKNAQGPFAGVLQGDLLKKVSQSSGSVTFDSPVKVSGELVSDSNQDATALGDVIKFLASMIQTNGQAEPVATLVQSLTVSTAGNVLKLGLLIPEAQLEALIESAHKQSGEKRIIERI